MKRNWRYALFVTTALLLVATHAAAAPADNPQILHSFCNFHQGCLDGQQPTYLAPGRGGVFHGIDSGAVFRVDPASRDFSIFHAFDGEEGRFSPAWLVSAPNGNLYGALVYDLLPGNAEIFACHLRATTRWCTLSTLTKTATWMFPTAHR